jgi:hypothetical protein
MDGIGSELSGFLHVRRKGELSKISGPTIQKKERRFRENWFYFKRSQPLSLLVQTDDFARYGGFRFGIYATYSQSDVAGAVVGIRVSHAEN